ncbi:hypothetical protein CC78DRAFT_526147 [Lojkania enalia]|uniref:Uncharacterized protein n=1 Tax=Lojkania enalia TaxID=147567 RepID=A0A9P4K0Q4_9PLEO|nr:hypothetical protein CC78DRAFT_526147 [Didymosphaeria enalia]
MEFKDQKCGFEGNQDMYGMGIRIGYYLQWYGAILASWIAPEESQGLRIANSLFVTATFLALVILTVRANTPEDIPIVETYIILFLAFGSYLVLVPIYIWRLFTGCNPLWDPTRFPRVNPGRVYSVCNTLLLVTVLIFQIWFWAHQVPKLNEQECRQWGFFFWKFELNRKTFIALNIIPSIFLLGILDSVSQGIVATVIIIGVELTIVWNEIEGVHDINSAGQTIPLFIGIGALAMVFYVRFFKRETEEVLAQSSDNKPSDIGLALVQGMEMGYHAPNASQPDLQYYQTYGQIHGQTHGPTHKPPPRPTTWDTLPGAARGGADGDGYSQGYY